MSGKFHFLQKYTCYDSYNLALVIGTSYPAHPIEMKTVDEKEKGPVIVIPKPSPKDDL